MDFKKIIMSAKDFIKDFCTKIMSTDMVDSAKQVYFLDNQKQIRETMESLNNVKSYFDNLGIELEDGSEEQQAYELCCGLMQKLTKTLTDYKNSQSAIKNDVTVEETTAVVTEETIANAAQNNSSTKQIIKDMNELNDKANVAQMQEFTHAIFAGKKPAVYVKATTVQELNTFINTVAEENPNEKLTVCEVIFNPIPLKRKTVYAVQ